MDLSPRLQLISVLLSQPHHLQQICSAIYAKHMAQFSKITALPATLRAQLAEELGDGILSLQLVSLVKGEQATKALLQVKRDPRLQVETVHMRYRRGGASLCISSQSGCAMGCTFCATGAMGLGGNLDADEITDQVLYWLQSKQTVDTISFMGMGEPLMNPKVFDALHILTDRKMFGFSARRLNVSTVGVIPGIQRLTEAFPQVNLAVSLHSPFEGQRAELMPITRHYPLPLCMQAIADHVKKTRRKVFLGYLLLDGVNTSADHAKALASLVKAQPPDSQHLLHVNLLKYNPSGGAYHRASSKATQAFLKVLERQRIPATLRHSPGEDISAACGQLYAKQKMPSHGQGPDETSAESAQQS